MFFYKIISLTISGQNVQIKVLTCLALKANDPIKNISQVVYYNKCSELKQYVYYSTIR